jgi:hypothetical protein
MKKGYINMESPPLNQRAQLYIIVNYLYAFYYQNIPSTDIASALQFCLIVPLAV